MLELTDTGWENLAFWEKPAWERLEDQLHDLKEPWNPGRKNLFRALQLCPLDKVKVVILGQDPYPNPLHATGVAFSIPDGVTPYPPTLKNILREYSADLHYEYPKESGNLEAWCQEGVLLWNSIPTCLSFRSLSHESWYDWTFLTHEIISECSKKGCVFILMGRRAETYRHLIDEFSSEVIVTPHPSPLARGFRGTRIFSTTNAHLVEMGLSPVDWRLNNKV